MSRCVICEQKAANCDCSPVEKHLYTLKEGLENRVEKLEEIVEALRSAVFELYAGRASTLPTQTIRLILGE